MSKTINMLSGAHKVKGQGVLSACEEQVNLVKNHLNNEYKVEINEIKFADIMHYHTINLEYFLTLPFTKIKSCTVGYVHFLPETLENSIKLPKIIKKIFYKYVIEFYKNMDYIITVNPYFIDKLVNYGIERDKITYIPNYVSSKNFFKIDKQEKIKVRKKYNISKDKFVILCVGQLQTRKGFFDFIEIAKKLPDIQFVWAGGFSFKKITDGYEKINKIVEDPPKNVKFLGIIPREEMNNIYNMADVMFLPSYEELFPMSVLESANCRLPIVLRNIDLYKGILDGYYLSGHTNDEFISIINKLKTELAFYIKASHMASLCSKHYSEENVSKIWKAYYNKIYKMSLKNKNKWRNL
ncbi:MAG: glycosyltransferase family 4 protein [Clostridia bacterium]|nr:glycosyltransferase family 4 protein [Clostridia bacterium]